MSRRCGQCGCPLSRDNTGDICGACAVAARGRPTPPVRLEPEFWSRPEVHGALSNRDWRALLAEVQKASGASQARIAEAAGVSQAHISRITTGRVTDPSLGTIEKILAGLGGPPLISGVSEDSLDLQTDSAVAVPSPDVNSLRGFTSQARTHQILNGDGTRFGANEPGLQALFQGIPLPGADSRVLAEAEMVRRKMDLTLAAGTVTSDQVDHLDEVVLGYRYAYPTAPPLIMLSQLMLDLTHVQSLAVNRQPAAIQQRLSHVTATLAVLAADALMKLGDTRQARAWYRTARTAADDTGDRHLRALVRAQEAMLPYYYGDLDEVLKLVREAQQIADGIACSPVALAVAAEARALARLGDADGAEQALTRAQDVFSRINSVPGRAFDFSEQRLHLYLSGTYAYLPDTARALSIQDEAFSAQSGGSVTLDPALIRLDQAISFARAGDTVTACQIGQVTLQEIPAGHRTHILHRRAREVLAALPAGEPATTSSNLRELLYLEGHSPGHA